MDPIIMKSAADRISHKCGLSIWSVLELLNKGWTYVESLNEPSRWNAPEAQFTDRKMQ